jgi:predicted metal-dependent hydrolase
MTRLATIALIALCIGMAAAGAPKKTVHYQDTKTVLAEIDNDKFGSTFISTIALNMNSGSPQEEIALLVDEIESILTSDQNEADAKNTTDQAVCDETIGGFNKQIYENTNTIASLEAAITDNKEILEQAHIDLTQAEKDYDETVDAINKGTAEREAEHSKWTEEDYEESIQIATLEEGVKLIQHMIHGVAFSQIKPRYDKVLEKLRATDNKRSTLFKPLINSLTQLATKLNYESVIKILDLLQNIRSGIVEEQEIAHQNEDKAQGDWEVLLSTLESQKQSLADKKARLGALISSTDDLLAQLQDSLENHKVELENLQESLASQTAWCAEQSENYETDSAERTRELSILSKLSEHISEKFASVGEYVQMRSFEF